LKAGEKQMHRFIVEGSCTVGEEIALLPDEAHHADSVLRLTPGEAVELLDGQGLYAAALTAVDRREVRAVVSARLPDREPRVRVTLFQALVKGDKFEGIIQKCTELGVHAVQPLEMARCVQRLLQADAKRAEAQRERWQRIAREAAKQCGRAWAPPVHLPARMGDAAIAGRWGEQQALIVPWEEAEGGSLREIFRAQDAPSRIGLVIGPEGGITEEEIARLHELGARVVTLGPRILRTETAGMAALAALMALCGEME